MYLQMKEMAKEVWQVDAEIYWLMELGINWLMGIEL